MNAEIILKMVHQDTEIKALKAECDRYRDAVRRAHAKAAADNCGGAYEVLDEVISEMARAKGGKSITKETS